MGDLVEATASPPKRRRRWRRWIVLGVLFALGACIGRFAYLRITLRPSPRPGYWLERLEVLDPPPPGALTEAEARAALAVVPGSETFVQAPDDLLQRGVESLTYAADGFVRQRKAVLAAIRATWHPSLSDANSGTQVSSERLIWGRLLVCHARWSRSRDKSLKTCHEDWSAVLGLIRNLGRYRQFGPVGEMGLLEQWLGEDLIETARGPLGDLDVHALAAEVDAGRPAIERMSQWFEGEKLAHYCALEEYYVREGGQWMDLSEMMRCCVKTRGRFAGGAPPRWWNLWSPLYYSLPEARASVDRQFDRLDRLTDFRAFSNPSGWLGSNVHALSALNGYVDIDARLAYGALAGLHYGQGMLDAGLAALALRVYCDQHGRYPDQLAELVPEYLPRLPIDYADLQPLRMRRTGKGYVLYSIGVDGRDDGGVERDSRGYRELRGPDFVFSVSTSREPGP